MQIPRPREAPKGNLMAELDALEKIKKCLPFWQPMEITGMPYELNKPFLLT